MAGDAGIDLDAFAAAFARLMEEVHALVPQAHGTALVQTIASHLGGDAASLPVVSQSFAVSEHPNVQLALERIASGSRGSQLLGLPVEAMHWHGFGLANLAAPGNNAPPFDAVAPAYVNVPVGVDETLPCVTVGVWLLHFDGAPVVALTSLGDAHHPMAGGLKIEAMSADRAHAVAFLGHVKTLAHELNVYRGKLLSFTFSPTGGFGLEFHRLPELVRDDLILPDADLDAIERHTLGVAAHADRLRAAGRHLKRGLLLFGPPGTGKTFSVMYLCGRMPERTTILLSGQAAPTLGQAAAIAKSLQPSMLVLEDVDLVAMERTLPGMHSNPLLFQLLNEMDGLDEDADVIFVLTTNRVDLLEPALSARPGRVDQAVEIKLPDDSCRRRLLARYLRGMPTTNLDVETAVARTEGVSAAFLKELCRRAGLMAAERTPPTVELVVSDTDLTAALDDLLEHSAPILRAMLGAARGGDGDVHDDLVIGFPGPGPFTGFMPQGFGGVQHIMRGAIEAGWTGYPTEDGDAV